MAIKLLSNDTIQKIAAGEVVENPYSVIKELVENSIDSGATTIKVETKNAGKREIVISDDGSGINEDEIELAFTKHATSKLENFDDLYSVLSYGFRGEALASISAVSKIDINTRTKDVELGVHCYLENNKILRKNKIGMNCGTTIYIRDLFYNVPIRKKFLKSEVYENTIITTLMYSFAISNPNISFKYVKDGKVVFETNNKNSFDENLMELFENSFVKNLIPIKIDDVDYKIYGYITNNNYYRANRNMQFLFVNNRFVYDEKIRGILEKSISSIIPKGKYPCFILFINANPNLIDVNVHPNKKKVKFIFEEKLINLLNSNVLDTVLKNTSSHYIELKEKKEEILFEDKKENIEVKVEDLEIDKKIENIETKTEETEIVYDDNYNNEVVSNFTYDDLFAVTNTEVSTVKENLLENMDYRVEEKVEVIEIEQSFIPQEKESVRSLLTYKTLGTIFNKYILLADSTEFLILNIVNAKHRIIYEKFVREYSNKSVNKQMLLFPIVLELTDFEFGTFTKIKENIQELGFDVDIFDENSVIIRTIPTIFEDNIDKEDIRALINGFSEKNQELNEKIYNFISKKRINTEITDFEISEILTELSNYDYEYNLFGKKIISKIKNVDFDKIFVK